MKREDIMQRAHQSKQNTDKTQILFIYIIILFRYLFCKLTILKAASLQIGLINKLKLLDSNLETKLKLIIIGLSLLNHYTSFVY